MAGLAVLDCEANERIPLLNLLSGLSSILIGKTNPDLSRVNDVKVLVVSRLEDVDPIDAGEIDLSSSSEASSELLVEDHGRPADKGGEERSFQ